MEGQDRYQLFLEVLIRDIHFGNFRTWNIMLYLESSSNRYQSQKWSQNDATFYGKNSVILLDILKIRLLRKAENMSQLQLENN